MIIRKLNIVQIEVRGRVIWFDLRDNIKGKERNKIEYIVWVKIWKVQKLG